MATARKSAARRSVTPGAADVTKALDALSDATERAQSAAKAIRADLGRSPLRADLGPRPRSQGPRSMLNTPTESWIAPPTSLA